MRSVASCESKVRHIKSAEVGVAANTYYPPVPYRRQHSTGIGTIVRAGAQKTMLIHDSLAVAAKQVD
jgi:hypothetical protein